MSNYLDMLHDCSELRKFITENPELPIVVLVGDETNTGDYQYVYCTQVKCTIGEVLDCELKESYYRQMVANVENAEETMCKNVGGQLTFGDLKG